MIDVKSETAFKCVLTVFPFTGPLDHVLHQYFVLTLKFQEILVFKAEVIKSLGKSIC